MARPCGPCSDKRRIELDRRLLEKDLTGESFRRIVEDFGYSETALRRHLENHIASDVSDVMGAMRAAREEALAQIKAEEAETLETVKAEARETTAARLENAASYLDQLILLRQKAADILETAAEAGDLKTALVGIREARGCIETLARIEGQLKDSPQITIINSPEWLELRTIIVSALRPHPEALEAVLDALPDESPRS